MTIHELCKQIGLQDSVTVKVKEFCLSYDFSQVNDILDELIMPQSAEAAYKRLSAVLGDDEDQIKMLSCQLFCATKAFDKYQEMGIPQQIFTDTMKCFTRFIGECKEKTGRYAFDRAWWTYRQLSMVLFRIGDLEYEFLEHDGVKKIDIHIPSDADFSPKIVDVSINRAKEFVNKYYPEYSDADYACESWLLAPKLREVLGEESNIINFQNRFHIFKQDMEAKDIYEWVFKTTEDCELNQLREDTFLQRKLKQLLRNGENIGVGFGTLK